MLRVLSFLLLSTQLFAQHWVTVKGTVTWPKDVAIPRPEVITPPPGPLAVNGPLLRDELIINPKNRGMQNVWVHLRPDDTNIRARFLPHEIRLDGWNPPPVIHDVDSPGYYYAPKVFAIRSGDYVNFRNTSPLVHAIKIDADEPSPSFRLPVVPFAGFTHKDPFVAQRSPIRFDSPIHPWMEGCFMVFDHPFFATTDNDGKFEIRNAPVGKYRLVYRHMQGYHKGREGRLGWPVEIKDGGKGTMELTPVEFVVPPR